MSTARWYGLAPHLGNGPGLWLLYRCADVAGARQRYNNRRLMDAAARSGLAAEMIHPDEVRARTLVVGRMQGSCAILSRSGAKLGRSGKRLLAAAEAKGALTLPSLACLEGVENKLIAGAVLRAACLPTPAAMRVTAQTPADWLGDRLGYPLVLKPALGSKGDFVLLCPSADEFHACLARLSGQGPVMAQRYVRTSHGRDLRVIVVGGLAIGAMTRVAPDGQLCTNIHQGARGFPAPLTGEIAELAAAAAAAFSLDIAGVDLLFDEDGMTVCEVNSAPGFEEFERVTGHDVAGAIIAHVRARLAARSAAGSVPARVAS